MILRQEVCTLRSLETGATYLILNKQSKFKTLQTRNKSTHVTKKTVLPTVVDLSLFPSACMFGYSHFWDPKLRFTSFLIESFFYLIKGAYMAWDSLLKLLVVRNFIISPSSASRSYRYQQYIVKTLTSATRF